MANKQCLAAFTSNSLHYPSYINISREENIIFVTIREAATVDGSCGQTASMAMELSDFFTLIRDI